MAQDQYLLWWEYEECVSRMQQSHLWEESDETPYLWVRWDKDNSVLFAVQFIPPETLVGKKWARYPFTVIGVSWDDDKATDYFTNHFFTGQAVVDRWEAATILQDELKLPEDAAHTMATIMSYVFNVGQVLDNPSKPLFNINHAARSARISKIRMELANGHDRRDERIEDTPDVGGDGETERGS